MDVTEASSSASSFFQDLENFGNAVGNTLDGLLTSDWDLGDDNDDNTSAASNMDSTTTTNRRRIARPLMFYNPVFYFFNRKVKNKDVPKFISSPNHKTVEEPKTATPLDTSPSFAQLRRGSVLNVGKSPHFTRKNSRAVKNSPQKVKKADDAPTSSSGGGNKISRAASSKRTTRRKKRSESQTAADTGGNVCTMTSVIDSMKTKDVASDPVAPPAAPEATPPSSSLSPTLQRNKTIRWGGTRKAPGLIREFTLKQDKKRAESDPLQSDQIQSKEIDAKANQSPSIYIKKEQLSYIKFSTLLPAAPQLKRTSTSKTRGLLQKLGSNPNNAFGYAVTKFVSEVKLGRETRPLIVLHDVRSFMTDVKTCLLLNPHFGFIQKIQSFSSQEENRTNVESGAIDDGLERLVLLPLHHVIYQQLVICYHTSGKLKMLEECFAVAKTKSAHELGVRSTLIPPDDEDFETIKRAFVQLQQTYSPYLKLKCLLTAVKAIYKKAQGNNLTTKQARCKTTNISARISLKTRRRTGREKLSIPSSRARRFCVCRKRLLIRRHRQANDVKYRFVAAKDLSSGENEPAKIGADDFLPLFVYSIVKCEFLAADIEAQYIEGLLDQSLLLGEAGYYLTSLISAMQVLFSMKQRQADLPHIYDLQAFLKVGIKPDNRTSTVIYKTLHVPPNMTSRNLCQMIALKYKIKNYQDYCLHVVIDGHAWPLRPDECPQLVKADLMTQMEKNAFHFDFIKITPNADGKADIAVASMETTIQQSSTSEPPITSSPKNPVLVVDQKKIVPVGKETQKEHGKQIPAKKELVPPNHANVQFYNPLCDDVDSDVGGGDDDATMKIDDQRSDEIALADVTVRREISQIFKEYTGPIVEEIFQPPPGKADQEDRQAVPTSQSVDAHESPIEIEIVIEHSESPDLKEKQVHDGKHKEKNVESQTPVSSPPLANDVKESSEDKATPCSVKVSTDSGPKETLDKEIGARASPTREEISPKKNDAASEIVERPKQKDNFVSNPEGLDPTEGAVNTELTTPADAGKLNDDSEKSAAFDSTFLESTDKQSEIVTEHFRKADVQVGEVDNTPQTAPDHTVVQVTGQDPDDQGMISDHCDQDKVDVVYEGQSPQAPEDHTTQELDGVPVASVVELVPNTERESEDTLIEAVVVDISTSITSHNTWEKTDEQLSIDTQHNDNTDENNIQRENTNEYDENTSKEGNKQGLIVDIMSKKENELTLSVEDPKLSDTFDGAQPFTVPTILDISRVEKTDNETAVSDTSSNTTVESTYTLDHSYQVVTTSNATETRNEPVPKPDNQPVKPKDVQQAQPTMQHRGNIDTHANSTPTDQSVTLEVQTSNIKSQGTTPDAHPENINNQELDDQPVEDNSPLGKLKLESNETPEDKITKTLGKSEDTNNKINNNLPPRTEEIQDKTTQIVATSREATTSHKTAPPKPPRSIASPKERTGALDTEMPKKPTLYLELDENLYRSFCRSAKVAELKKFFESKNE